MEENSQVSNFEQKKIFNALLYKKKFFQSLRRGHLPPFDWKLFKLGSVSVRDIRKNVPILQVGGFTLAPPIPPVFRVVLLHKWRFSNPFIPQLYTFQPISLTKIQLDPQKFRFQNSKLEI